MEMTTLTTRTARPVHAVILDAETGDVTERSVTVDGLACTAAEAVESVREAGLDVVTEGGLVEISPDGDWTVTVEDPDGFAGADITVEVSRHTIDPQGESPDEWVEECKEHILDAVREAFPGATVHAGGRGARTSGTARNGANIAPDVLRVVNEAFNEFCG